MLRTSIFLILFMGSSCANKEVDCKCYKGIGSDKNSTPIKTFQFENKKSVSICGFSEKNLFSEFDIFDCENGKSLVQYSALQNCEIEFKDNEIVIFETLMLSNNEHWYFSPERITEQKIIAYKNEILVEKITPLKIKSSIPKSQQIEFLKTYKTVTLPIETKINRLETLALIGNKKAEEILRKFNNEQNLDGGLKEYYDQVIRNLNFRNKAGT